MPRKEKNKKQPEKKHPLQMTDEELDELVKKQKREHFWIGVAAQATVASIICGSIVGLLWLFGVFDEAPVPYANTDYDDCKRRNSGFGEDFGWVCHEGRDGVGAIVDFDRCLAMQRCVSGVTHYKAGGVGEAPLLGYEETMRKLKASDYNQKTVTHRSGDYVKSYQINSACDRVSRTYNPESLAGHIFRHIPEVTSKATSSQLGKKAIVGYGECLCVLSDFVGVKITTSIGKCEGPKFIEGE